MLNLPCFDLFHGRIIFWLTSGLIHELNRLGQCEMSTTNTTNLFVSYIFFVTSCRLLSHPADSIVSESQ